MLHQVGVGALGPVFRTYEPTRDRLVAVKVFRLDITPEQAQRLADELSVAADARLFHPSIVEPIAAGVQGTVAYRAEEYVAAESLDVAMRHYAPASLDKVMPFITQLADAIDFARSAGVGHGALHPRDIFVTPDEARATGFGVVEALERVGLRAPVRRPYSAPERVTGEGWSTPADIFSLAAITYELLTSRRPTGPGEEIGVISGSAVGEHEAAVHDVLARAMAAVPAQRYGSALEFISALDSASRGEHTPAASAAWIPAAAAAPAAAAIVDAEEAVSEMPPPTDIDVRSEPVRTEQFERPLAADDTADTAADADYDDVVAEREADEAHLALSLDDLSSENDPSLSDPSAFDEEAVEDLALEQTADRDTERFADEFAEAAREDRREPFAEAETAAASYASEHYAAHVPLSDYADEHRLHDRSGPSFFTVGAIAVLALIVGFVAGYMVGTAGEGAARQETANRVEPAASGQPGTSAAQPYSEQAVAPPQRSTEAPATTTAKPPTVEKGSPPAPRPAPPATTGRLVVESSPAGAAVTIDGRWRGRTPLTVGDVRFGSHNVRVVQPGYAVASEEVALSADEPSRTLSFTLRRNRPEPARRSATAQPQPTERRSQSSTGSIYVDSRPRGARVLVDGKLMGTTPVLIPNVSIGSHVVRLQLDDHREWTTTIPVLAGKEAKVSGSLERIR